MASGQVKNVLDPLEQAVAIFHELGESEEEGNALLNLSTYYNEQGQQECAMEVANQAIGIFRTLGNRHREAMTLRNMGSIYARLKQLDKALEATQMSVEIYDEIGGAPGDDGAREQLETLQKRAAKKWWQVWI